MMCFFVLEGFSLEFVWVRAAGGCTKKIKTNQIEGVGHGHKQPNGCTYMTWHVDICSGWLEKIIVLS